MEALHGDDDPTNNRPENLRWGTRSDNLHDAVRNGKHPGSLRTHCPRGHEFITENLTPSALKRGKRKCLSCDRGRAWLQNHPDSADTLQDAGDRYFDEILRTQESASWTFPGPARK